VNYVPRPGDFILLQDSRQYFETQDLFQFLERHWVLKPCSRLGDGVNSQPRPRR
jgi:hypothetical protein